jgi:uncharacterized protein with PQ loop repeat
MRKWIDLLSLAGTAIAIYLLIHERMSPGFCPRYPIIGIPACYLVLVFFILVFVVRYIKGKRVAQIIFWTVCIAGILTAAWFSTSHLLGNLQCPVLLNIPLCFAALLTFLALQISGFIDSNSIVSNY